MNKSLVAGATFFAGIAIAVPTRKHPSRSTPTSWLRAYRNGRRSEASRLAPEHGLRQAALPKPFDMVEYDRRSGNRFGNCELSG